jgi:S1-C subfamily serine protease
MPREAEDNLLSSLSTSLADAVASVGASVVAIHGGGHWPTSGILWKPGVVVTAEEALPKDEGLAVTLPDGRRVEASFAGRDVSTAIAVLKLSETMSVNLPERSTSERAGEIAMAVGRDETGPRATLGIIASSGGPWRSMRGGQIDRRVRLDTRLDPRIEGGAVVNASGRLIGLAVAGPRRITLAIPGATVDRVSEQLLADGRIARGYLGLGLQPLRLDEAQKASLKTETETAAIVVNVDAAGPGATAGILLGDFVTAWNGEPIGGMRSLVQRLGPESVGTTVKLSLVRGGQPLTSEIGIIERPAS